MYLLMAGNGLPMRLATLPTTVNVVFITFARDRYVRGRGMWSDRMECRQTAWNVVRPHGMSSDRTMVQ